MKPLSSADMDVTVQVTASSEMTASVSTIVRRLRVGHGCSPSRCWKWEIRMLVMSRSSLVQNPRRYPALAWLAAGIALRAVLSDTVMVGSTWPISISVYKLSCGIALRTVHSDAIMIGSARHISISFDRPSPGIASRADFSGKIAVLLWHCVLCGDWKFERRFHCKSTRVDIHDHFHLKSGYDNEMSM